MLKGKTLLIIFFDELYSDYQIQRVWATRMVNANSQKRGKLTELMISNIAPIKNGDCLNNLQLAI